MLYVVYFVFVLYVAILLILSRGWTRAMQTRTATSDVSSAITVVVAVRNEEENILNLLGDLRLQTYPYLEIIVVDDESTDGTREMVSRYCTTSPNTKLLLSQGSGKKQALTTGIQASQGSIVVTTDADCRVSATWIESIGSTFADTKTQLAFGLVRMQDENWFENIQAVEFASVIGTGVGAFGIGQPVFCNGANLSFRKSAFIAVDGYRGNFEVPSGDDEFLLRKILASFPDGVTLLDPSSTTVTTRPNSTLKSLFNQRIRWAGKWKYASGTSRFFAVVVMMIHVCLLGAIVAMLSGIDLVFLPVLWAAKMMAEYYLISRVCRVLKVKLRAISFVTLQLTYSLYVVSIGILSNFTPYRWKKRTVTPPVMRA